MTIKHLLMSALMLAACSQAFAQEKEVLVFPADGAPADGLVIEGTNISYKLGNDGKWKSAPEFIPAGTATADFKQPYIDSNGASQEGIAFVSGNNNPKDGLLNDDNVSTGNGYKPSSQNVPRSGTYYMITPTVAGNVRAVVVLNANKSLYVTKSDGALLDPADGGYKLLQPNGNEMAFDPETKLFAHAEGDSNTNEYSVGAKVNGGIVEFTAEAGETYYIFCTGSKLGFAGVEFTPGSDNPGPGPEPSGVRGDLDNDGKVTVTDIMILINIFLGVSQ